ncbi:RagB/SusD family nutrient uptake outer membrane protein [Hymenobacter sp. 15J16-1T3B]|uniref:RagB/SusD family nutrient uptake outer membrane protein n=1 Tax=Hymenobacter sp. 15J16-1T3B TaxID=2886941 RepID=UPI001D129D22|nr:RagB/SusD family nutrient uptake outer membrane protein [Hymenobacter sp. 15J16-1T3B]MCC3160534.1 RagB/SusD family nutrient uptake outer membrane protein [Hymenobacter sp. 15J16-1T3B]
MKKIFLLLAAAALLTATGCEDLDQAPISSGSVPTFYKSADDFNQALNATYSTLRSWPDRTLTMSETRSDNIYGVSTQGIRTWEPINNFSLGVVANEYPADAWSADYLAIYRANVLLDQLEQNGTVLTDAARKSTEAQARFLRAFYYFDLVRYFGRVPLVDKPLEPQDVAKLGRAPVADVYSLIVSDLQNAAANLPVSYAAADAGRVTSGAAKSLLALVYMTRSGDTYGGIQGPGLGTNDYAAALGLLNEVIASGQYQLITAAGTSPNAYANVFSYTNESNNGNREVIFDVQYISGGVGLGGSFPSILVTNNYFTSIGVGTTFGTGDELRPASNSLLNSYATGDLRKGVNFQVGYTAGTAVETRAAFKKYINGALRGTTRTDWPINFIVLRYADVLLLKAECLLRSGGSQSEALGLVNQIRRRAYGLSITAPSPVADLTSVNLDQLLEERRREFAGEGIRWHDLVRTGRMVSVMNAWITADDTNNRIRKPLNANDVLYPVPQQEMAASSYSYEQNPGY